MKYIKKFENLMGPEVGDYVALISDDDHDKVINFLDKNIGKIFKKISDDCYGVEFDNYFLNQNKFYFMIDKILFYSKNKEEVETYLLSRKYNL